MDWRNRQNGDANRSEDLLRSGVDQFRAGLAFVSTTGVNVCSFCCTSPIYFYGFCSSGSHVGVRTRHNAE